MTSPRRGIARIAIPVLLSAVVLTACGGSSTTSDADGGTDASSPENPTAIASALASGTDKAKSATCGYYTRAEISDVLGAKVGEGHDAASGFGCQWTDDSQDNVSAIVTVVEPRYYEDPSLADGYEEVSGIGTKAYVVPQLGGYQAGSLLENKAVGVIMSGGKSSKDAAVAFLRETVKRAG